MMKVKSTDTRPSHKKGENAIALRKIRTSVRAFISKADSGRAVFLKQNCVNVSKKSTEMKNNKILKVRLPFFDNLYSN